MYDIIKKKIKTVDGIKSMSREQLFYAWKYLEEGILLDISQKCFDELVWQCSISL